MDGADNSAVAVEQMEAHMKVYRLPVAIALIRLIVGIAIALNPAGNGWSGIYFLVIDFPGALLYGPIERLIPSVWALALLGAVWWYFFALFLEYMVLQVAQAFRSR